jgi:4a-hydroxytetrahydrobiopterin dehydratase
VSDDRRRLGDAEVTEALRSLPGWSLADGKLHREYRFRDFVEAIGFLASASMVVQEMDHHPEWSNVYHRVSIDLVTHSAGGVTPMDVKLATRLEELAARVAAT